MNEDSITKNLLLDKTCKTCKARKSHGDDGNFCIRYLGEACGWQWWPQDKNNTCEDWNG